MQDEHTNAWEAYRPAQLSRGSNSTHLEPKVTLRQFSEYRKIKSIYVKTM